MWQVEADYKTRLKALTTEEKHSFDQFYHRDVALHWGSDHGLLPQGKPLPDASCLRHFETQHTTSVSVVMCMRNELIYLLLRTLTTIVRRTPQHLLREIVLIDDGSEVDNLPEIINYCSQLNIPLKTLKNNRSMGITTCRKHGIEQAEGEVVVLLDSHMEVSELWLEPLLDILHSKPDAIAVPNLHLFHEKDYDLYHHQVYRAYGIEATAGYSYFRFYVAGPRENDQSEPYPTASVLGGGLVAHKSTFLRLYPQIVFHELWGTENTRLSIRAWNCGGGLWMTRCSQILHTNGNDGELKRYQINSPNMRKNLQHETVAEIINFINDIGEKTQFLQAVYEKDQDVEVVRGVAETIATQFNVSNECSKDYRWWLENIFPSDHFYNFISTDYHMVGVFQSMADKDYCIRVNDGIVVVDKFCRLSNEIFYNPHVLGFTQSGEIQVIFNYLFCIDSQPGTADGTKLITYSCHTRLWPGEKPGRTQTFRYNETTLQIEHFSTNRCAQVDMGEKIVTLWKCSDAQEQKWAFHKSRWS